MNRAILQQKIPIMVLILLILAMVSALSAQAYLFFLSLRDAPLQRSQQTRPELANPARPQRVLENFELFGEPSGEPQAAKSVKTEDLPKTSLSLVLRGVSASTNIEKVSALIEGPDKETLKYGINDPLPGKAKLKNVYEKRVVIERNGRLENLYFPDDVGIGIVRNEVAGRPRRDRKAPSSGLPEIQVPDDYARPAAALDSLSDQRKQEIKQKLQQLRERMEQSRQ